MKKSKKSWKDLIDRPSVQEQISKHHPSRIKDEKKIVVDVDGKPVKLKLKRLYTDRNNKLGFYK